MKLHFQDNRSRKPPSLAAFTLVELLVVIAVIAILAALLLPSLNGGKVEAESAVCKSNLRQLTLAMRLYTEDNGAYPYEHDGLTWPVKLQPYSGAPWPDANYSFDQKKFEYTSYLGPRASVWACPAYNRMQGAFTLLGGSAGFNRGAYGYNVYGLAGTPGIFSQNGGQGNNVLSYGLGGTDLGPPTRENQVASPSDMIALGDAFIDVNPLGGLTWLELVFETVEFYDQDVKGLPPGNPAFQAMRQRHWGKSNIGFCDGHVESLRTNDLINLHNSAVAARWNNDHQAHNQSYFTP